MFIRIVVESWDKLEIELDFYYKTSNEDCNNNQWNNVFDIVKPNNTKSRGFFGVVIDFFDGFFTQNPPYKQYRT